MKKMIIFTSVLIFIGCHRDISREIRLKQRVDAYHASIISGDYASSWTYLWHDGKRRHNLKEWVLFCRKAAKDRRLLEYRIDSFSISRVKKGTYYAKVKLTGMNKIVRSDKVEKLQGEDEWVFENGDWYRYID